VRCVFSLYRVADKFGFEVLKEITVQRLVALASYKTLKILEFGLHEHHLEITQAALSNIGSDFRSWYNGRGGRVLEGSLSPSIASLSLEMFDRVGSPTIRHLLSLEREVIFQGKLWRDLAKTFVSRESASNFFVLGP